MQVPLFDTRSQYEPLLPRVEAAIQGVVATGRFVLGPEVEAFERELAAYLGVGHVVTVANGTDALTIALRAVGVGPGDEVVVPAYTFYATAEAIPHAGARPVFCDIDPRTFCVTAETVAAAITPRTRAVICVHLFGNVAPMDELRALAQERGIAIVEDTAQAAGARLNGWRAGALGDVATFSFFPSKNLFCFGDGGAVATDDEKVAQAARILRFHGSRDKSTFEQVGYNSRLDAIQAALLRTFLPELDGWNEARREVADRYAASGLGEHVALPVPTPGAGHVYHSYVVRSERRDALLAGLRAAGVEARAWYEQPLHVQPALREFAPAGGLGSLPATAEAARTNLALPMAPSVTEDQIEMVVSAVADLDRSH